MNFRIFTVTKEEKVMKRLLMTGAALVLGTGLAFAQTTAPAPNTAPGVVAPNAVPTAPNTAPMPTQRPAVQGQGQQPNAPLPGANSFTEGQARERIQNSGFSNVTGLRKDDNGIWRGLATRNGAQLPVAVDYQGNVFQQ
jgi:putative membrane protein